MTYVHRAARWLDRSLVGNAGTPRAPDLWRLPSVRPLPVASGTCRLSHIPGPGPRLLFAVDGPNVIEQYQGLQSALAGRADLAIVEPPGTGGSRPSRTFDYSGQSFVDWATEVLTHLGPRVLVFPCYLGFVAQWTAHARPDLVTALALSQTPCWADMAAWLDRVDPRGLLRVPILGQLATRARRDQLVGGWYRASAGGPTQSAMLTRHAQACLHAGGAFCLASLVQGFFDTGPPPPVSHPVWLAWGDRDRTHRYSEPERSVTGSTVTRFGHTGHSPELEDPEGFVTALLAFLETP